MIQLKTLGTLCIMLVLSLAAKAGDVTAVWDFQNDLPAGIKTATAFECSQLWRASLCLLMPPTAN